METEDKNQEEETYYQFIAIQIKKEKGRKSRAEMWVIEQQMKASLKFAEENGGA